MYLFSRSTRIANADGMAWAVEMTEHAKRVTGLDIGLWGQVWSPEFGRIAWTTFVPDLATLADAGDKMAADAAMNEEGAKGAELTTGGMDDGLFNILHGEITPNAPQAEYVTTVTAVCANGSLTKGMTTGVEIAQRAEKITGVPTMFVANVTGQYGGVGWMTGFVDTQGLEASQQAMAADEDWAKQVDKAGAVYAADPGVTTQLIHRRFGVVPPSAAPCPDKAGGRAASRERRGRRCGTRGAPRRPRHESSDPTEDGTPLRLDKTLDRSRECAVG